MKYSASFAALLATFGAAPSVFASHESCTNSPSGWVDSLGDGCSWYAENGCAVADLYGNQGYTANEVCCVCGGGCTNSPSGWVDSTGDGCSWYVENGCSLGDDFRNQGYTANEACCVCGGGIRQSGPTTPTGPSPTRSPTRSPTSSRSDTCTNSPSGWVDSGDDECSWYAENGCGDADEYENQGLTANEVCCVCGGGIRQSGPTTPTGPSPTGPSPRGDTITGQSAPGSDDGTNVGAIVGGIVGGLVLVGGIVGGIFAYKHYEKKNKSAAGAASGAASGAKPVENKSLYSEDLGVEGVDEAITMAGASEDSGAPAENKSLCSEDLEVKVVDEATTMTGASEDWGAPELKETVVEELPDGKKKTTTTITYADGNKMVTVTEE